MGPAREQRRSARGKKSSPSPAGKQKSRKQESRKALRGDKERGRGAEQGRTGAERNSSEAVHGGPTGVPKYKSQRLL